MDSRKRGKANQEEMTQESGFFFQTRKRKCNRSGECLAINSDWTHPNRPLKQVQREKKTSRMCQRTRSLKLVFAASSPERSTREHRKTNFNVSGILDPDLTPPPPPRDPFFIIRLYLVYHQPTSYNRSQRPLPATFAETQMTSQSGGDKQTHVNPSPSPSIQTESQMRPSLH